VGRFGTDPATIAFDVQTTYTKKQQSLMGERSVCNNPSEGWWDIRVAGGVVHAEFGAGPPGTTTSYIDAAGSIPITDGQWHHVVVHRDDTGVTVKTDGKPPAFTRGAAANIDPPKATFG